MRPLLVFFLASLVSGVVGAAPVILSASGPGKALIELYTSEGCSSCPPAERWLSSLRNDSDLWARWVPVAFHVDYWDNLGWKDRFDDPRFARRQRAYAAQWGSGVIYTPGFVVNGHEWRGSAVERVAENHRLAGGTLRASYDDETLSVRFEPAADVRGAVQIHAALLGFGLVTDVQAGENSGRTLRHDFVVLDYRESRATPNADGVYTEILRLRRGGTVAPRYAVAVWVSEGDRIGPMQATGGWIDGQ